MKCLAAGAAMVGMCPAPWRINPPLVVRPPVTANVSGGLGGSPVRAETFVVRSCNRTRTYNLPVNSRLLCQLGYAGLLWPSVLGAGRGSGPAVRD